jgi:ribonuclease E
MPAMERAAEAAPAPASALRAKGGEQVSAIEPVKAAKAAVEPAPERPSAGGSVSATASDAPPPRPRAVEAAPMAVADLLPMVESSGLKLAQTDPQKLAAAQARAAAMQPPSEHNGRERPVVPPIEEAPLTQVETRAQP